MVRPYPMELRTRATDALADGATCRQVAERFAISLGGGEVVAAVAPDR